MLAFGEPIRLFPTGQEGGSNRMPEHKELETGISDIKELNKRARLSPREVRKIEQVTNAHPMRISQYYLTLIDWNDPADPIRKMAALCRRTKP